MFVCWCVCVGEGALRLTGAVVPYFVFVLWRFRTTHYSEVSLTCTCTNIVAVYSVAITVHADL